MRAASIAHSPAEVVVADNPKPDLAADSVLVEVHTAALNPIDRILRAGYLKKMFPISFPYVMGDDLSGGVSEVAAMLRSVWCARSGSSGVRAG